MIHRIEISSKFSDTRALIRQKKLEETGPRGKIKEVSLIDVYTIDKDFSLSQLQKIASSLSNPVSQSNG